VDKVWDLVRMIAAARVIMPASMVRLSAGRVSLSPSEQALCFFAGANSIFTGDKLLTTPNSDMDEDKMLFETLGIRGKPPVFAEEEEQRDDMVAAQPFIAEEEYVKQNAVAQ